MGRLSGRTCVKVRVTGRNGPETRIGELMMEGRERVTSRRSVQGRGRPAYLGKLTKTLQGMPGLGFVSRTAKVHCGGLHSRSTAMQDRIADHPLRTTTPWNRGKLIGPKPPLKAIEIWSIRVRLQVAQRVRDLALFNLALDSKLRACDLMALRVDDVALNGRVRSRATIMQRKTGRPVQFEITEQTREAVGRWLEKKDLHKGEPLFPSRINRQRSMTTRQYARLLASGFTRSDWIPWPTAHSPCGGPKPR